MPKVRYNEYEEDVLSLADEYVAMVYDYLKELAPLRPFWQVPLDSEAALFRYMEIRDKIIPWLTTAAAYMGYATWGDALDHLDEFWFGTKLTDMVPPNVIDELPPELVEIVQASPKDAGGYIRKMEKLFEERTAEYQQIQAAQEGTVSAPEAKLPPVAPSVESGYNPPPAGFE